MRDWEIAAAQRFAHGNHRFMAGTRRQPPAPVLEAFPPAAPRHVWAELALIGAAAAAALILLAV